MGKPDFWGSLFVIKRDGKKVNFKGEKIAVAIKKGFDSVENEAYSEEDTNKVYLKVLETIEKELQMYKEFFAGNEVEVFLKDKEVSLLQAEVDKLNSENGFRRVE